MDATSMQKSAAPSAVPNRELNLAQWIRRQYESHRGVESDLVYLHSGTPLRLATARRALIRYDFPEEERKVLLAKIRYMLRLHANTALEMHKMSRIPEHPEESALHQESVISKEPRIPIQYESIL